MEKTILLPCSWPGQVILERPSSINMDVQYDESSMASSGDNSSSNLEYKTCGKIAQLVLTRLEYLVDGFDTLQRSAYQGEEYGCHSRSSPVQTQPDNWDAQGQGHSRSIAESQDHGQGNESMDDSDLSTHELDRDQEIIEEKYKGQDNLGEHDQCSDHFLQHPIGMTVLKSEIVVGGGEEEEQNGGLVDEGPLVKKEEMEEDTFMHNESFSPNSSYRSTIEPYTQQSQNNELDEDQVIIEEKCKGQDNLNEHGQCSDQNWHHPIEMIVLKPEEEIAEGEEEEQNGGIVDQGPLVKKEEMEEDTFMHNESFSPNSSYRSTIEPYTQQSQNNELDEDQVIIEEKCKGQDNLNEHGQCSDQNWHHPIEMIVLKPEEEIAEGEEEEQNGGIVDQGPLVKKEEMEEDTFMHNESFSPNSSYRSTIEPYTQQSQNNELEEDQVIIEEKCKGQDNLNEHGQCSDPNSHHPIEMIVLKPEEDIAEGEEEEQNGGIVDEGPHVKKEDPLMHIETFTSHSSYRSTIKPHPQEHLKVEDVEGIGGGETNEKYHSSSTMMQIHDSVYTIIDNFVSENESNVMNTQHMGAEPVGNQESSFFNECINDSSGISLLTQTPHVYSNKSYTCKYCDYETNKEFDLTKHSHTHTGERPYCCEFCDKTFITKSHLNKHLLTHTGERPFSCEFCDRTFSQKSHLNTHLHTHTGERPYSCEFCNKTFNQTSHLNTHLHTHTGERPHSCEFCDKTFITKSHLNKHLLTHTGERPHSCEFCDKTFYQKSHLIRHLLTHTGERPHSCEFCDKTFNNKSSLNSHLHTHTGENPYSCEFCDKTFNNKSHLNQHLYTHTGERPFSCEFCDRTFSQKSNLNTHLHTHTGERPYSCEFCDKTFNQKSSLNRHLLTHTGERPYSCDFCDYKTANKSHLNTHLRTHTGERPYSCELCDKTFNEKSTLTTHLYTHTGERPHSCDFCDYKTARKADLTTHLYTHTGERPHSCDFCDYKTARKADLNRHLRTRHK